MKVRFADKVEKIIKCKLLTSFLFAAALMSQGSTAVATTWYVNGVNGSNSNDCMSSLTACKTIGHAISLAASGDTIRVAAATYTENLSIAISLKILGAGASTTIVDGGRAGTVVIISNANAYVTLSSLTIRNGFAVSGGGVHNYGMLTVNYSIISGNHASALRGGFGAFGGGILNQYQASATINNSTIKNNVATGLYNSIGGGIDNAGSLTINNSTVNSNSAVSAKYGNEGGAIFNGGTMTINNNTISSNSVSSGSSGSTNEGGGIFAGSTLKINNTTISGNSATSGGGIYNNNNSTVTFQNSIVANSPSGGNCSGSVTSDGYNLSSDGTCNFNAAGDLNHTNTLLGPLQNNGGPTQTMALGSSSPAIDAGNPGGCTDGHGHLLTTDQRGQPRPDNEDSAGCDMGAYETQSVASGKY